jgi:hypothetical protein
MALQKDIEQPSGYVASYWMIEDFIIQKKAQHARFVLAGYKSQSVRQESPTEGVLTRRTIAINGDEFDRWYKDVVVEKHFRAYEAAYEYIKTREESEFAGATDILE